MTRTTLLQRGSISVSDFRCSAGPDDTPFAEQFGGHSISYVRTGSFGCHSRGRFFELVAGSILVGHPGDEFICTHDHVCGDECLSFFLAPELVQAIGDRTEVWRVGAAPPLPELMVLGELARRPTAAAMSASMRSDTPLPAVLSRWSAGGRKSLRRRPPGIAAARWKPPCGSMRIRTGQSTWRTPQVRPTSARSISCGCFRACSG
jgi:hypothetical protein